MDKPLPPRPDLDYDRKAARGLLVAFQAGDAQARDRVLRHLPRLAGADRGALDAAQFKLSEAQLVIAREYGFESWAKLKRHIETVRAGDNPLFARFLDELSAERYGQAAMLLREYPEIAAGSIYAAAAAGDAAALREHLAEDLTLAREKGGLRQMEPLLYTSFSLLHRAGPQYSAGLCECARLLLAAGADPNAYYIDPDWPDSPQACLYGATGHGNHPALARILLEAGANTQDGESIYHSAQFNYVECLELLAQFGADFSQRQEPWGNTPLYFLLGHRETDTQRPVADLGIQWLLEHGADPNVTSRPDDDNALNEACRNGRSGDMVRRLLAHGADPSHVSRDGRTAYALAMVTGNASAAQALREAGADSPLSPVEEFLAACSLGAEARARELAASQPGLVASLGPEELRVLTDAANEGRTAVVRLMLSLGFDVAAKCDGDATALHVAAWRGHADTVEEILRWNPPLEVHDTLYDGRPLDWAIHGSQFCASTAHGDYVRIVRALLEAGAVKPKQLWGSAEVQATLREAGVGA